MASEVRALLASKMKWGESLNAFSFGIHRHSLCQLYICQRFVFINELFPTFADRTLFEIFIFCPKIQL